MTNFSIRRVAKLPNALALLLLGGCANSTEVPVNNGQDPQSIRTFIGNQVGGLTNLMVPADDEAIPVPPDDPLRPGRYKTTRAKTYLGKLLFHDPVRTARINLNTEQPLNLPVGTAFGGTVQTVPQR